MINSVAQWLWVVSRPNTFLQCLATTKVSQAGHGDLELCVKLDSAGMS